MDRHATMVKRGNRPATSESLLVPAERAEIITEAVRRVQR
jgi:hypothetical protein